MFLSSNIDFDLSLLLTLLFSLSLLFRIESALR